MGKNELAKISSKKYEIGCVSENKKQFYIDVRKTSLQDIVSSETLPPSMIKLQQSHSQERIADEIVLIMLEFQNFYNVKSKLDEFQLYDIAFMIMEEYRHLNLLDIGILFKYVKLGKYGKVYDRIDGGMVLEWVKQYENERMDMIIANSESEHAKTKFEGTRTNESLPFNKFFKK